MNLSISKEAKEFILNNKKDKNGEYFTLIVKGGGCAGLSYEFSFKTEDELRNNLMLNISNDDELEVWTTKVSVIYLTDCEIRYGNDLNSKGLEVYNPHAIRTCACGESFSL